MVKLGISVLPHLSFCCKTRAHQWLWLSVQGTGAQSLLHHLCRSLQHLLADLHNQQKPGGVSFQSFLGSPQQ